MEHHAASTSAPIDSRSYMDYLGGRLNHNYSDAVLNTYRLYDFYSRQADFYRSREDVPEIIPSFPGLDAGLYGHWGKYGANGLADDRWNRMDIGTAVGAIINKQPKSLNLHLGNQGQMAASFNHDMLSFTSIWEGGFLEFPASRWGMQSPVESVGDVAFKTTDENHAGWSLDDTFSELPANSKYLGNYRHGKRAVLHYKVNNVKIYEIAWAMDVDGKNIMSRTIAFDDRMDKVFIKLRPVFDGEQLSVLASANELQSFTISNDSSVQIMSVKPVGLSSQNVAISTSKNKKHVFVKATNIKKGTRLVISFTSVPKGSDIKSLRNKIEQIPIQKYEGFVSNRPTEWHKTYNVNGTLGTENRPYVIDNIPIPHENEYNSMMFLTGLGFLSNGDLAVCTFMGDVWLVKDIGNDLKNITWKRFASGLTQPLGLEVINDKIYVNCRDQIAILHDLNGDEEADFYECFTNQMPVTIGAHGFHSGLQRDAEGNLYFVNNSSGFMKVSPDGAKVESLAMGIRNPNGVGVSKKTGMITASLQEGTHTPACAVIAIQKGDFYGYQTDGTQEIAPAYCYLPRGIDNSSSGQIFAEEGNWGPLDDQLIHFSFGAAAWMVILQNTVNGVGQGAVMPMPGDFASGVHRGRFSPFDKQLYVVGSDGWGSYASQVGGLDRVRYTGKKAFLPVSFHPHYNGIKITFSERLDKNAARDVTKYFLQQWNYEYSNRYGSPEYSVRQPGKIGHDRMDVKSVHLLGDQRTIFIEIPDIVPVMQMHINARLKGPKGEDFLLDIYPTLKKLDKPFKEFPEYAEIDSGKETTLALRMNFKKKPPKHGYEFTPKGRLVLVKAVAGLQFDLKEIRCKSGEQLRIALMNEDDMPHNLVLSAPGAYQMVGEACEAFASDPQAHENDYVKPGMKEVLGNTIVVMPGGVDTFVWTAPDEPGEYTYLCTFPGHWRLMKGKMIVELNEEIQ